MNDDAVFEEDYDKVHRRYKFTLPNLQPGCIVDFRYQLRQKYVFNTDDWEFQCAIPEAWSEFQVVIPKTFAYAVVKQGFEKFLVADVTDDQRIFHGDFARVVGSNRVECSKFHYIVKDAPAVRDEPYMTTPDDYTQKVSLQLAEYITPYSNGVVSVMKTWKTAVTELLEDDHVGKAVDDTKAVRRITEPLIADLKTPEEKMRAIYDYVRKNIVWSGKTRYTTEQDVDDLLDSKNGSSAEISALVLSMLKAAGINGCQVILSTRTNGRGQDLYPIMGQYNYMLVCVTLNGKNYFLDATDRFRPMEVLPVRVLNTRGLLVRPENVDWVTLSTGAYYRHALSASAQLFATGELKGSVQSVDKEYAALAHRRALQDETSTELMKSILGTDRSLLTVDTATVEGKDSTDGPLTIHAEIEGASYTEPAGDLLYVNPFFVERDYDNPLKRPTRKYPIDMMYPQEQTWDVTLALPPEYEVKELPKDKDAVVGRDASFRRTCRLDGHTLVMHAALVMRRSEFGPDEYKGLKDFFEKMTSIESDQLVLKKLAPPKMTGK